MKTTMIACCIFMLSQAPLLTYLYFVMDISLSNYSGFEVFGFGGAFAISAMIFNIGIDYDN